MTGSFQVFDKNQRLLGYALLKKGVVETFQPNRLCGKQLNLVFSALKSSDFSGLRLKEAKAKADSNTEDARDWHSLTVTDQARRRAWINRQRDDFV